MLSVANQFTPADRRKRTVDASDSIARVHLEASIETLQTQLYAFKDALTKNSTVDLVESDQHQTSLPRIGEKVSKLSSVSTNLVKRYQLARAARVEANRRLKVCSRLSTLRSFIDYEASFKPVKGMIGSRDYLRDTVAFSRTQLIDKPVSKLLGQVVDTEIFAEQTIAAYIIQRWIRM